MKSEEILEKFKDFNYAMEMYSLLNIDIGVLNDPVAVSKVTDIANFLNTFSDGINLVRSAAMKSDPKERLNKTWNYVALQNKRLAMENDLGKLKEEISLYE